MPSMRDSVISSCFIVKGDFPFIVGKPVFLWEQIRKGFLELNSNNSKTKPSSIQQGITQYEFPIRQRPTDRPARSSPALQYEANHLAYSDWRACAHLYHLENLSGRHQHFRPPGKYNSQQYHFLVDLGICMYGHVRPGLYHQIISALWWETQLQSCHRSHLAMGVCLSYVTFRSWGFSCCYLDVDEGKDSHR